MFCGNCGNNIPDGSNVCPNCGVALNAAPAAPVAPVQPVAPVAPVAAAPKANPVDTVKATVGKMDKKVKMIIAGVAGVAVLAIIIAIIVGIAGGGAEGAAKKYFNAVYAKNDAEAVMKCVPNKVLDEIFNNSENDEKDTLEAMQDSLDTQKKEAEFDDLKVVSTQELKMSEKEKNDTLDEIEKSLEARDLDIEVSDVATVLVIYSYEYHGTKGEDVTVKNMYKINGKWVPASALEKVIEYANQVEDFNY